jgi:hypothetical protein
MGNTIEMILIRRLTAGPSFFLRFAARSKKPKGRSQTKKYFLNRNGGPE